MIGLLAKTLYVILLNGEKNSVRYYLNIKTFLHVQAKHFARSGTVQHEHVFELCTV